MYQFYQQLKKSRVTDETVGDKAMVDRLTVTLMLQRRVVVHMTPLPFEESSGFIGISPTSGTW